MGEFILMIEEAEDFYKDKSQHQKETDAKRNEEEILFFPQLFYAIFSAPNTGFKQTSHNS